MANFLLHVIGVAAVFGVWGLAHGDATRRLGLLSLAGALIAGVGAYGFAIAARSGIDAPSSTLIGVVSAAVAGVALAQISRRARGHDYVLATFAAMIIWEGAVATLREITGGAFGISRLPGLPFAEALGVPAAFALLAMLLFVLVCLTIWLSARRRLDVALQLLRRSIALARTFDVPVSSVLSLHGAWLGALCGAAGVLYAAYVGFVGPSSFPLATSITIAALSLAASRGFLLFLAALLLFVACPELLRLIGASGAMAAQVKLAISGAGLALLALTAPSVDRNQVGGCAP